MLSRYLTCNKECIHNLTVFSFLCLNKEDTVINTVDKKISSVIHQGTEWENLIYHIANISERICNGKPRPIFIDKKHQYIFTDTNIGTISVSSPIVPTDISWFYHHHIGMIKLSVSKLVSEKTH